MRFPRPRAIPGVTEVGHVAKKIRCRLGLHHWATFVREGEQYVACKDCRRYGRHNTPTRPFGVWTYRDK